MLFQLTKLITRTQNPAFVVYFWVKSITHCLKDYKQFFFPVVNLPVYQCKLHMCHYTMESLTGVSTETRKMLDLSQMVIWTPGTWKIHIVPFYSILPFYRSTLLYILDTSANHFVPSPWFLKMSYTSHLTRFEKVFNTAKTNENHITMTGNATLTSEASPFQAKSCLIMLCGGGFILRWLCYGTREKRFSWEISDSKIIAKCHWPLRSNVYLQNFPLKHIWETLQRYS